MDASHLIANTLTENTHQSRLERLEALVNGQTEVLEMISQGAALVEILEAIISWVEKQSSQELYASILFLDEGGQHMVHGAAPSLPKAYIDAVNGLKIGPDVGSCGTAMWRKEPVIVDNIETDPLWNDYQQLALQFGLRACWSVPMLQKDGKVVGTFAIYYTEPKSPTPDDLQLIRLVSRTTELAIELKRTEEEKGRLRMVEKRQFELLEKERHHFYQLLMDSPALIAVLRGPTYIYELANPLYIKVVAGKRNIIGKQIREALPELEGQGIYPLLDSVYHTGKAYINNEFLVRLDRKETGTLENVYFNFIFQPIKNTEGITGGILIHAVDVTELVHARKVAEESESRFKSFVLNSPSPIGIYIGREMRVQTANEAILQAWGKDESVIGKTFREALPELEGQPFYDLLDKVYSTGISYNESEGRVDLYRNGKLEITYFNFTYKALRDPDGKIYGVINTGTEVTDLVLAKQKLAEAREGLRMAIDLAEMGTWYYDIASKAVRLSDRLRGWFGLANEYEHFETVVDCIDEEDRKKLLDIIAHTISIQGTYEIEYRVHNKIDGKVRIIQAQGRVVTNEKAEVTRLNGTARDITLQRMNEHELEEQVEARTLELKKANLELHNVNQNLKQFAYVASHDLQEPLRKINMFSDLLVQKNKMNLDNFGRIYLEKITQSSKRMTTLIKDLLDFSRVDARKAALVPTDLNGIIRNIMTDFEVLIHQKGAEFNLDKLLEIEAVPFQMNQLFYNLVSNALKYSKEDVPPVISISSRILLHKELTSHELPNPRWTYCEVIVQDNGIGFDQQFAEQIFTIFQRLHGRGEYEGTGIGLALCKKIVDSHDGIIYARSEEGKGSSFHVLLPVSRS
jgi:PAS domain S-box-containing protein